MECTLYALANHQSLTRYNCDLTLLLPIRSFFLFVHFNAHMLKSEGVLISEFSHVSLNARKQGTYLWISFDCKRKCLLHGNVGKKGTSTQKNRGCASLPG